MDSLIQLINLVSVSEIKHLIINFEKNIMKIINEVENETNIEIIKEKIHILSSFFNNKNIIELLDKIKNENNYKKIKILFKETKNLILKEINILVNMN